MDYTGKCLKILQLEADLQEIVKLVGMDSLSADDRLTLDVAQSIREDFLQQNAFVDVDSFTPLEKQYDMLGLIFQYEESARRAVAAGVDINAICELPVHEMIGRAKSVSNEEYSAEFAKTKAAIKEQVEKLIASAGQDH
jgi:V/A-type H+-transporting ATPase subunit A